MSQSSMPGQPAARLRVDSSQMKDAGERAGGHSRKRLDLTG